MPPAGHDTALKYRPDIDGLRAVAVLSVLFFHTGIAWFRGGFVGVDIFFVISGYLISLVIHDRVVAGDFSFGAFYERRVRRIFPAFFAAVSFTAALSYLYLMPRSLHDFSWSLLTALLSASNFYFMVNSGYFDPPAAGQPLLQTWSLAVEEQFYLFLPVLIVLSARMWRDGVRRVIAVVAVVSLIVSAASVAAYPEAAFYMLHTRAWELLLGAMVSLRIVPEIVPAWQRNLASLLGLGLIAFALLFFSPSTPFPGGAALVPCAGAALIIAAGRNGASLVGGALALPPVRFIGLISYSLYLWHWPVVVFQKSDAFLIEGPLWTGKAAIIVASLLAGAVSWRFIELPFRRMSFLTRRQLFLTAGAGAAVMAAEVALLLAAPPRFPPEVVAVAAYLGDPGRHLRHGTCFISSNYSYRDYDRELCRTTAVGKKNYLLLGDSHAAHLWYGLSQVFGEVNFLQDTAAGCKPTLADTRGFGACHAAMDDVFNAYLADHPIDRLLLAARWKQADLPALAATLDWAKARHIPVVVFGPMVEYDSALPRLLALSLRRHDPGLPARHRLDDGGLDRRMAALAAAKSAAYISLEDVLCPGGACVVMAAAGVPLQFDYSHLTREGSLLLARRLGADGLLP